MRFVNCFHIRIIIYYLLLVYINTCIIDLVTLIVVYKISKIGYDSYMKTINLFHKS